MTILKKKGYLWVTLSLFIISLTLHIILGWKAYVNEQESLGQTVKVGEYLIQWGRDVFENLQSEFLQLIWQVAGLAMLLHVGSPQSKEGDQRKEAKIDLLIENILGEEGKKEIINIEKKYPKE